MNIFSKLWNKFTVKKEVVEEDTKAVKKGPKAAPNPKPVELIHNDPRGGSVFRRAIFKIKARWNQMVSRLFKKSKSSEANAVMDRADAEMNDIYKHIAAENRGESLDRESIGRESIGRESVAREQAREKMSVKEIREEIIGVANQIKTERVNGRKSISMKLAKAL